MALATIRRRQENAGRTPVFYLGGERRQNVLVIRIQTRVRFINYIIHWPTAVTTGCQKYCRDCDTSSQKRTASEQISHNYLVEIPEFSG
jgi:hypothetical protein